MQYFVCAIYADKQCFATSCDARCAKEAIEIAREEASDRIFVVDVLTISEGEIVSVANFTHAA